MSSSAPKLCVADVSMTFQTRSGAFRALAPVTLAIPQGRFVSLIGPSGCGKTTIFNIIAGLLEPTGGRVLIDGVDATGRRARPRNPDSHPATSTMRTAIVSRYKNSCRFSRSATSTRTRCATLIVRARVIAPPQSSSPWDDDKMTRNLWPWL